MNNEYEINKNFFGSFLNYIEVDFTPIILSYLFYDHINFNIFTLFLIFFSMSLIFQIKKFRITDAKSCLDSFKINNISGILLFTTIFLINF